MLTKIAGKDLWLEVDGSGPAVVMIHGLGGTTTFDDAVTAALVARHQVIRFDFNAHGRSPLTGAITIADLAADIAAVLDHLGVESADVIGHSAGTVVVQQFAADHPERTGKVVLLGAVRELPDAGRATKADRPEIVGYVREMILGQDDEGYAAAVDAAASSTDVEQSAIAGPVLVVTGSADGVSPPEKAERIAAGFPDGRVEVIEGIGHWTVVEAGNQVSSLIAAFLG